MTELKVISTAEVKKHRTKESGVWMIIHNNVYDVTSFLEEHPGGEDSLLDVAGKEATQDFEDVGHSDDARELMKKYVIGTLPAEETSDTKPEGSLTPQDKYNIPPCRSLEPAKSEYKPPTAPRPEGRVKAIYVPKERKQPEPPRSNLKWAVLALAGAVVIGFALKKYLSK